MIFKDLYEFAEQIAQPIVPVTRLARQVEQQHEFVEEVRFYTPKLDPNVSFGHIKWEMDRSSAYDGEFLVASIRIHDDLLKHFRRFVACKELMQVFDSPEAKTNTREKFIQLLNELERFPVASNISPMLASELEAEWMALAVLCPRPVRDRYLRMKEAGEITPAKIADTLRIPESWMSTLLSDEYDRNLLSLGV